MAKKKKAHMQICVAKEDRYPRGIVREAIDYLKLFMPVTLAIRLLCILFVVFGMKNARIDPSCWLPCQNCTDCTQKDGERERRRNDGHRKRRWPQA